MTLSCKEIPASFAGQAFHFGHTNTWINGHFDHNTSFIGSSVSFFKITVVSHIYSLAVAIFCAPRGVVYHTTTALIERVSAFTLEDRGEQDRRIALAWEHLKAAGTDLAVLSFCSPLTFKFKNNDSFLCCLFVIAVGLNLVSLLGVSEGWLFSSKVVTIPNAPEKVRDENIDVNLGNEISKIWGRVNLAPPRSISYSILKTQIWKQWSSTHEHLPESDERIILPSLERMWKDATDTASFWAEIWPQHPQQVSLTSSFARRIDALTPAYTHSWEAVSLSIQGIAWGALGLGMGMLFIGALFSNSTISNYNTEAALSAYAALVMGVFHRAIRCYQEAVKSYIDHHGLTEYNFANQILKNTQNVEEALDWYKEAALRGYVPAQRTLGLAILAELSRYPNVKDMDDDNLLLVGEGVRWLQAAEQNGDVEAINFLRNCFQLNTYNCLYQGVTAASETEKVKQMFRFESPNILNEAVTLFEKAYPKNDQLGKKIKSGLVVTRKVITQAIIDSTNICPDVAQLVASYF